MKDAIGTHTHPIGSPLSVSDWEMAAHADMQELRAFGVEKGKLVKYSIERPEAGWPSRETIRETLKSNVSYMAAVEDFRSGKIKQQQASDIMHKASQASAKQLGVKYTRITK